MKKIFYLMVGIFTISLIIFTGCKTIEKKENKKIQVYDAKKIKQNILAELNFVRTNPSKYATEVLLPILRNFNGKNYRYGTEILKTKEGTQAVLECIKDLKSTNPMPELSLEKGLNLAAQWLADDQAQTGIPGHIGSDYLKMTNRINKYGEWGISCAENCAYGRKIPRDIVIQLLVDDGLKARVHRKNILNPKFLKFGIGYTEEGKAPYGSVTVMNFAEEYISY